VALRYQRQKLLADHGGVKTYQGIDPLTGLPVLIYAFNGKPHLLLNELESENIPGVLGSQSEGQQSQVVVAYARGYKLASRPLEMDAWSFLIEGSRALKDAAEIGVLHGDIRPERFWVSSDHVFVEGFGLPWAVEDGPYKPPERLSSFAGDVYSWAKAVLHLLDVPASAKPILDLCLNREPNLRLTAEQVHAALLEAKAQPHASLTPPVSAAPTQAPSASTGNTLEIDFNLSDEALSPTPATKQPTMQGMPKPPAPAKPDVLSDLSDLDIQISSPATKSLPQPKPQPFPSSFDEEVLEPMVLNSDPGLRQPPKQSQVPLEDRVKPKPKDPKQPFIKDLPPGATYKAGKAESNPNVVYKETPPPPTFDDVFLKNQSSRRNSRRGFLLLALFLGALVLAGLAFFRQRTVTVANGSNTSASNYIVNVIVEPANMPPIQLNIVSSPEGSARKPGVQLATVSGQNALITLDKVGLWQFQGQFQDLKSEVVSLQLPEQRTLTIVMPVPPITPDGTTEEPVEPTTPTPENP
jgi:serine/threonine protein kinase